MNYNVSQLLKEPVGSTRNYTVDDLASIDGGTIQVLPSGNLTFMRTDSGILVTAGLKTRLRMVCSRCLEGYLLPLSLFIEEEFLPTVDVHIVHLFLSEEAAAQEDVDVIGLSILSGAHL